MRLATPEKDARSDKRRSSSAEKRLFSQADATERLLCRSLARSLSFVSLAPRNGELRNHISQAPDTQATALLNYSTRDQFCSSMSFILPGLSRENLCQTATGQFFLHPSNGHILCGESWR